MAQRGELLTVGHSNHEETRFIGLLKEAGVQTIADVRAQPRSGRYPQFNAAALAASLEAADIGYETLGRQLGGRRTPQPESSRNRPGRRRIPRLRRPHGEPRFLRRARRPREIARTTRTAVMCAEGDWRICHRRLVADAMTIARLDVRHLRPRRHDRRSRARRPPRARGGRADDVPGTAWPDLLEV